MKVAAKVALSSGSILALLLLSAAISVWGLSTAKDNFSTYRSLARQTAAAGEAQAQLLTARIVVIDSILTRREASVRMVTERIDASAAALGSAMQLFTDHAQLLLVQTEAEGLRGYDNALALRSQFPGEGSRRRSP